AYYTGIVFELFDARGELRAICGGGRYDTLLKALTGADLPALGFGMGDVVLGELLRERKLLLPRAPGIDVWVAYSDDSAVSAAMRVACRLRELGRSVEYALGPQKLARQFKSADSAGAREVLVLSPDMLARDEAVLRRLEDGTERRVSLESWISGAAVAR
ncbi:MAG: ATP phosphoribosyltransferase regulatory subunit, partial [Gemmatimonadaceae bacterium]